MIRERKPEGVFMPLTLEMGSWSWVRKNPSQMLSVLGPFNPVVPHRVRRTLRRHLPLFDFLYRAVASPAAWTDTNAPGFQGLRRQALELWFSS